MKRRAGSTAAVRGEHATGIIDRANEVLSDLRTAEAGRRGFISAGDSGYFAPNRAARADRHERPEPLVPSFAHRPPEPRR